MKKILLAAALFCSTFFFSQKNQNYLKISYSSVCCGPASEKPVISYLKEFKRKNQIRSLEILMQKGMGREGEFELYVGTDFLTINQRKRLVRGLMASISNQNNNKKSQNIGNINFDPADIAHQEDLMNVKNLTIYKK
ncbi:hypothetical protein BBH99_05235 [Chryseobacterium contaminans]|uniref:Uncharacterized protein n=1 Tax=Chryseobacterium contaminans TaxID=1423959 RepID=A0A1M7FRH1_9FLAO|nr:hypothetical protein [Chryseobacterium contaminans]OCA79850.1 hypothetical protein BBH99_05235 [Chryseobacterium contaminans]SHM06576.1 hypothetical protein SAMN05444407_10928 [Chryseobacterium contaminans]